MSFVNRNDYFWRVNKSSCPHRCYSNRLTDGTVAERSFATGESGSHDSHAYGPPTLFPTHRCKERGERRGSVFCLVYFIPWLLRKSESLLQRLKMQTWGLLTSMFGEQITPSTCNLFRIFANMDLGLEDEIYEKDTKI